MVHSRTCVEVQIVSAFSILQQVWQSKEYMDPDHDKFDSLLFLIDSKAINIIPAHLRQVSNDCAVIGASVKMSDMQHLFICSRCRSLDGLCYERKCSIFNDTSDLPGRTITL